MLKKSVSSLNAQKLSFILGGSIVLLIAATIAVFLLARSALVTYTTEVQQISSEASSSSQNLTALNTLKKNLANSQASIERAKSLVAESQSYAYQDQIIKDISIYASKAGVRIAGFQFNEAAANGAAAPAAGATTATPATGSAPTAGAAPAAGGLKTVSVALNLESPLSYKNTMDFIHLIEQNLTKMQLAGISLSKDATTNELTASALTIEVYVR